MTQKTTLKGVSIGAGYFSQFHFDAWNRIPEVTLAAICDLDRSKAEAHMLKYGIEYYYSDYREMIEKEQPDFVDIITPPSTHLPVVQYAAQKKISIICQKPLAPTMDDSRQIVRLAQDSGIRFMVHDNWRWQPWYREIKKIVGAGVIGEVFTAYFQMRMGDGWGEDAYLDRQPFFREYEKLLIFESGVHFIDTFRFLFGEIEKVYAQLQQLNPVIKGEDSGQVLFNFQKGTTVILDANRYNENETGVNLYTCDPRTTFGIMRLDGSGGHLIMDSCGDLIIKKLGQDSYHHEYSHPLRGFAGDSCHATLRHFIDCLLSDQEFETNGPDYLKTLEVVEACYRSAEIGNPILMD
jgi:predicted dehydrogenase